MYSTAAPLLMYNHPSSAGVLTIRFKPNANTADALVKTGAIVKSDYPGYGFEYQFIDSDFDQLFKTETLTGSLAGVFASLAIFISCLGLFGLAAYTAERRIKEIGIRKVLKLVAISCVIAFPAALWLAKHWLQGYEYRISINWWIFPIAGTAALLIALATISYQAIKAALTNPVKSLRSE
jgi:ABC-type antimicrobial peptide transport system permease subunit